MDAFGELKRVSTPGHHCISSALGVTASVIILMYRRYGLVAFETKVYTASSRLESQ